VKPLGSGSVLESAVRSGAEGLDLEVALKVWIAKWWERLLGRARRELSVDARALALMRIALGGLVIADMLARLEDASVLYSDEGFLPRNDVATPVFWGYRLYWLSGEPALSTALLVTTAALALGFAIGWQTRIMNVCVWLLLGALHARNELVLQGGDGLLLHLLLWSLLLPVGARWSIDARKQEAVPSRFVGAPAILLYVQLVLVYFVTGTLKANHLHWWRGEGVYHALHADHFVTEAGRWLRSHTTVLSLLTWGTLALEILGPIVLVCTRAESRLRALLVLGFMAFHAGIGATLELGLFSYVSIASWLFALPSWLFDRLPSRLRGPPGAEQRIGPRWVAVLAAIVAVYLVAATAVRDKMADGAVRGVLLWPATTLRLQLIWGLFIGPREDTGWYVVQASRADGRHVDLLRGGAPVSWHPPEDVLDTFPNQRWRKLLVTFRKEHGRAPLRRYLSWLCKIPPSTDTERVTEVRYVYVKHELGSPDTERELIGRQRCAR
jgi:hypothetical protein